MFTSLKNITQLNYLIESEKLEIILTILQSRTDIRTNNGYDRDGFVRVIENKDFQSVIPPQSNRKKPRNYDSHLYKKRHLIDCFFSKNKTLSKSVFTI